MASKGNPVYKFRVSMMYRTIFVFIIELLLEMCAHYSDVVSRTIGLLVLFFEMQLVCSDLATLTLEGVPGCKSLRTPVLGHSWLKILNEQTQPKANKELLHYS